MGFSINIGLKEIAAVGILVITIKTLDSILKAHKV